MGESSLKSVEQRWLWLKTRLSTSGHHGVDILPDFLDNDQVENILVLEANLSHKEKLNQVEKIRKQFGHASVNNMEELIRNTNLSDSEVSQLLKEVVDNCATFITFKKASARPIVSLSKADDFNQTPYHLIYMKLNMDQNYGIWIDEFTGYSAGAILTNKAAVGKKFKWKVCD